MDKAAKTVFANVVAAPGKELVVLITAVTAPVSEESTSCTKYAVLSVPSKRSSSSMAWRKSFMPTAGAGRGPEARVDICFMPWAGGE